MPETIQGLGRVLAEWRNDDKDAAGVSASVDEWAARLRNYGCSASLPDLVYLLKQAERYDLWTLPFTCGCFNDFLLAFKAGIYRGQQDVTRWDDLNTVFVPAKMRSLLPPRYWLIP